MKVIYGIGKVKKAFKNAVLAIGVFDGLHIGHQKVIKTAVKKAESLGGPAIVMTFYPHPVQVLSPESCLPFVASLSSRLDLIGRLGVTVCLVIHFTKRFSRLTARQFIKRYLVDRIRPKEVFVGDDFRFGRNRDGTLRYFKETGRMYGFTVNIVRPVKAGQKKIGSSRIRHLIAEGKLHRAERFLGRHVSLTGKVVKGDGRGRMLGFPTANLRPRDEVIPPIGVYAVRVTVGNKRLGGMANIGRRPSFKKSQGRVNVEIYIFDFKKTLYHKEITVEFIKKIRKEKTFDSKEKLVGQLRRDEVQARSILH